MHSCANENNLNVMQISCFIEIPNQWETEELKGCQLKYFSGTANEDLKSLNIHYKCETSKCKC